MANDKVTIYGGRPVFGRAPAAGEILVGDGSGFGLVPAGISESGGVLTFAGPITVDGAIESTVDGFKFPDGSTQTTAASSAPSVADGELFANISGSPGAPVGETLSDYLDAVVSSTQGALLVRDATEWTELAPGASGSVLQSQGAGADLIWGGVGSLWQLSVKSADQSLTSSTTMTDISGLSFPVGANASYRFRATLVCYAGAGGFQFTVNGPASPTRVDFAIIGASISITSYGSFFTSSSGSANALISMTGLIENGANAGDVFLQFRQSTSNAAATTVKSSSWIEWQEI